jgi:hypothetical protein
MSLKDRAAKVFQAATTGGVASSFFGLFQGRCTFFAISFSIIGCYGWLQGRDLTSFAVFAGAIQGLLIAHSWKEDIAEQNEIRNKTTVVINTSK